MRIWKKLCTSAIAVAFATVAVSGLSSAAAGAEAKLRATLTLPVNHSINIPFKQFMKEVNDTGKGIVQIQLLGGPEVMPVKEQMSAISRGIVDLSYGATAYYRGQIPEVTAFNGSNKTAMQLRKDGATAFMDEIFQERLKVKLLGYYGSGYAFHIYLRKPAPRTADGGINLKGIKVRGSASYASQFEALGITRIEVHGAEIYSALERGLLEGVGWVTMGVTDLGWEQFLKYRIFPTFKQGDLGIVINLDKWNSLSKEQQAFLEKMTIKYEAIIHDHFKDASVKENATLKKAGMTDIRLSGEGARHYLSAFNDTVWPPMEKKVGKERTAKLKSLFWD